MVRRLIAFACALLACPALADVRWQPAGTVRFESDCSLTTLNCGSGNICVDNFGGIGNARFHVCDPAADAGLGNFIAITNAGGGGGIPQAQYLTLALDGTLLNERLFTPGVTLSGSDGGAGGAYTLGINLSNQNTWTARQFFSIDATGDAPGFLLEDVVADTGAREIGRFDRSGLDGTGGHSTSFRFSDGDTVLESGDDIWQFRFSGTTAAGVFSEAVREIVDADGAWTVSSAPGRWSIWTTPSGSLTPRESLRVDQAGNIGIIVAGALVDGIDVGAHAHTGGTGGAAVAFGSLSGTAPDITIESGPEASVFFKDTDPIDPDVNVEIRVDCTSGGIGTEDCGLAIWQQRDGVLTRRIDMQEAGQAHIWRVPEQLVLENTNAGANIEIPFRDWADSVDDDMNHALLFVNLTDTASGSEDAQMGFAIARAGAIPPTTVLLLHPESGTRFLITPPTFVDVDFEWEDGINTLTWTQPTLTGNRAVTWASDPTGQVATTGNSNTFTSIQTFGGISLSNAASSTGDPADAGVLRLSNTDQVCWESSPAGADICASAGGVNVMATTAFDRQGTQAGTCVFSAAVSCTVTLPVAEADALYLVQTTCNGSWIDWTSGKTATQFVINASTSNSDTCDWRLIR